MVRPEVPNGWISFSMGKLSKVLSKAYMSSLFFTVRPSCNLYYEGQRCFRQAVRMAGLPIGLVMCRSSSGWPCNAGDLLIPKSLKIIILLTLQKLPFSHLHIWEIAVARWSDFQDFLD